MQTIMAFDPGKITGVALGSFGDDVPLQVMDAEAVTYDEFIDVARNEVVPELDHVVVEVFESRANEFAADLTGVRVEGILETWFDNIVWRSPADKVQVPDRILKEHNLWVKGSDVDWEDGRDVNDAIIHMLGHVAFGLKHLPTLNAYFRRS